MLHYFYNTVLLDKYILLILHNKIVVDALSTSKYIQIVIMNICMSIDMHVDIDYDSNITKFNIGGRGIHTETRQRPKKL